jgi:hypothetical protein
MDAGRLVLLAASLSGAAALGSPAQEEVKVDAETLRLRDRAALLDVRTVMMASKQFAARNGALFGPLTCLTRPETCLTGFPRVEAPFLDPTHDWLETRHGYARKFHLGLKASPDTVRAAGASPESYKYFAFTTAPVKPGDTGLRSFCGDSSGKICFIASGAPPTVKDGRCAPPCRELK